MRLTSDEEEMSLKLQLGEFYCRNAECDSLAEISTVISEYN
jgi:hypothetical protein